VTRGTLEAALRQEVGARATETRGGPGAALSWESGTTPMPPPPRAVWVWWYLSRPQIIHIG
jgi:hypothetical protein